MKASTSPFILILRWVIPLVGTMFMSAAVAEKLTFPLSGNQKIPSTVTGTVELSIKKNRTVSGLLRVTNLDAAVAHIHEGAPGESGPVVVDLIKISSTAFAIRKGTRLSKAQYASYQAGKLYADVHSKDHEGGELHARITPH
ncbi:CHRD domain-containing protein [Denitratisoma oestradiolicum]|uniref:CHRD domain-containing protein n=1 Tax=Denitratisoma oestradiolicum TaxID=311182 RepID=A0A6S6XTY0_9PROT|nr:CHRD domain-containing protein [Denitratisoma oestradiolicum]CAB1368250.1 conserved protein of unknown function [Denitratisoma oestradiolicum]